MKLVTVREALLRRGLLAALGVAVLLAAAAAAQGEPNRERVVLPNGLTVIAVQDNSSAIGAFHLAVRVNPESIPESRSGVVALSQQCLQVALRDLYKQEPWQALGEEVRSTRGALALNTEPDYAEVRCQLAAPALATALKLAGKLAFGAVEATPEQVTAARDALSNAVADSEQDVLETTYYRLLRAFYGNHSPLARPVQGSTATLSALTAADINSFRATFLGPNNASVCLIGPYRTEQLLGMAREAMAGYKPSRTTATREALPPLPGDCRISVACAPDWRGASMMVGVGAPPYGTDGFLRAQLIYTLLAGPQGRLQKDPEFRALGRNPLVRRDEEQQPAVSVIAPMAAPRPLLIMHTVVSPPLLETARSLLLGHLLAFATRPPQPEELEPAKQRLINAYAMMQLSRLNLAKELNCYEIYGQDYRRAWSAEEQIRAIKPEDLMQLARECFSTHSIGLLMPGDEEEQ